MKKLLTLKEFIATEQYYDSKNVYDFGTLEVFRNPIINELDTIEGSIKEARGFVTKDGDLYVWNVACFHKDTLRTFKFNGVEFKDVDLLELKYGVPVHVIKHTVYVGGSEVYKSNNRIKSKINEFFNKAKQKNLSLKFSLDSVADVWNHRLLKNQARAF